MGANYREKFAELGFSRVEVDAIEFVLLRMGFFVPACDHERPKFVECYEPDANSEVNEQRWWKAMREMGFRPDSIRLAEHGLGMCLPGCELCPTRGTA